MSSGSNVRDAPDKDGNRPGAPSDPAPTGQSWAATETDEGCGRSGVRWVLVDEVCGNGDGNDDVQPLYAPMFRDGAVRGNQLFTIDATHLWSLDVSNANAITRSALLTGVGEPLAMATWHDELVLASGREGLVLVNAANPAAPERSRSLELDGIAFDVEVAGDDAFVSLGTGGLADVDLAASSPATKAHWSLPGFTASAATKNGYAFVAACSTFKVVNLATGTVVGSAWVPQPMVKGRLVAPAKKVTLVGDVAFVAAGRYGAVAIDVSTPTQPKVLGNCTVDDESFYASGVRASGSKLFVAGGEWGILSVDVSNPLTACAMLRAEEPPASTDPSCSPKPPWDEIPWEKIWAPPPPSKDPIQTLPAGDRVYAFGDARRIGTRAIDVRSSSNLSTYMGRYDEPRAVLGIVSNGEKVVAVGPRGGVFRVDGAQGLVREPSAEDEVLRASESVALLPDGRWATIDETQLHVQGGIAATTTSVPRAIATEGATKVVVATNLGLDVYDVTTNTSSFRSTAVSRLPPSIAADASSVYVAAPEWTRALHVTGTSVVDLPEHGVFDDQEILDTSLWRRRLPRRHLVTTPDALVEIAGLGPSVGLVVHRPGGDAKVSLPPLTYAAAAAEQDRVYVVGIDRNIYRSYLISVRIVGGAPQVVSSESFTGGASGVAAAGNKVYVADADGRIRIYGVAPSGAAIPSTIVELGDAQ